jgi:DMSO/TMAO reductase YedYZ molybdopterin-dependent catalytic subunit
VLDCTGGWYAEQEWEGIRLDRLLGPVGTARSVLVRSVTGYSRRFPVSDVDRLWLATACAGRSLSTGHGGPARLVAPGRRGFWWVKWVSRVEVVEGPWWRQPPFPLQ